MNKTLQTALMVGGVLSLAIGCQMNRLATTNKSTKAEICHGNGCILSAPDISTTIQPRNINSLCDSNGIACRNTYDGKTARITGKFSELKEGWLSGGWMTLTIEDRNDWLSKVDCQIAPIANNQIFNNYRKGMNVVIQGTIEIDNIRPQIENCQVISELP